MNRIPTRNLVQSASRLGAPPRLGPHCLTKVKPVVIIPKKGTTAKGTTTKGIKTIHPFLRSEIKPFTPVTPMRSPLRVTSSSPAASGDSRASAQIQKRGAHSLSIQDASPPNLLSQLYFPPSFSRSILLPELSNPFQVVRNKYKLYKRGILNYSGTIRTNTKHKYNNLTLIAILLGCGSLSCAAWYLRRVDTESASKLERRFRKWLSKNILASENNLKEGKLWTLASTCLVHINLAHLTGNLGILALVAGPVLAKIGSARFFLLFFGAGTVSSICCLGWDEVALHYIYKGTPRMKT